MNCFHYYVNLLALLFQLDYMSKKLNDKFNESQQQTHPFTLPELKIVHSKADFERLVIHVFINIYKLKTFYAIVAPIIITVIIIF